MAGVLEDLAACADGRGRRSSRRGEDGREERHHPVAEVLVDEPTVVVDGFGGDEVEALEQAMELGRSEGFGEAGRAADIGEQERRLDLRAAQPPVQASGADAA